MRFNKKCKNRSTRVKPTKKEQLEVNERVAEKKLRRLLNNNFQPGDSHTVLDYDPKERPADNDSMRRDKDKFLRDLRKVYKK